MTLKNKNYHYLAILIIAIYAFFINWISGNVGAMPIDTFGFLDPSYSILKNKLPIRDFWAFTQFGANIIATNGADNIQKFEEGVDSAFSDLVTLKAKYLAVIRDFVVSGYTTESSTVYNQRVKWSGLNDSSTWTPSQTTQSGFQDIVGTHGSVQAIVGGESFGIVFMERAIFRMDYVGTPLIFQFSE